MDIVNEHRKKLTLILDDYWELPELVLHDLDEYLYLINGQAQNEIDIFLSTEHTIEECKKYVITYHTFAIEIEINVSPAIEVGIFEVQRHDTINALCKQAEKLKKMIVSRMTSTYLAMGKK